MSTATLTKPAETAIDEVHTFKTYAAKSSVVRAAIKANPQFKKEQIEVGKDADGYFWSNAAALLNPPAEIKVKRKFSTATSPCALVWSIAEKMAGAKRKDIISACQEEGVAFYTARTQYQKYTEALRGDIK